MLSYGWRAQLYYAWPMIVAHAILVSPQVPSWDRDSDLDLGLTILIGNFQSLKEHPIISRVAGPLHLMAAYLDKYALKS